MAKINPQNNNGSILIRFSHKKNRHSFTPIPGGQWESESDRKMAAAIANQIELDIKTGHFDDSLDKYRQGMKGVQTGIEKINQDLKQMRQNQAKPDLLELWERFTAYKAKFLSPSTIKTDYQRRIKNCLVQLPTTDLNDAVIIRDWIMENKPQSQAKKIITMIAACCDWGIESELLEINPFLGMAKRIGSKKSQKTEDINPFTKEERDRIIEAFENSKQYSHYAPLVKFLFFTGCRPSEALAVTWKDLRGNILTFNKAFVDGTLQKGLKTQDKRIIKLTQKTLDGLEDLNRNTSLIFPSKSGKYIDWHNFTNRAWENILLSLEDIEYRSPYKCRHTFITLQSKEGKNSADIASYVGNSTGMIDSRYRGHSRILVMSEI